MDLVIVQDPLCPESYIFQWSHLLICTVLIFFSSLCPQRTDFAAFPPYLLRALGAWSFSLALPCRENLLQKAAQSFPYAHAVFRFGRVDITIFQRSVHGWQSSCWNYVLYPGENKVIPICFIQCRRLGERRGEEGGRQGSNPYSSALSSAPLSPCPVSPLLPFSHLSLSLSLSTVWWEETDKETSKST